MDETPVVYVIDEDTASRQAIVDLVQQHGCEVRLCADAASFVRAFDRRRVGCLIADLRVGGISNGLLRHLREMNDPLPVIVVAESSDVATAVSAMRQGALTFLQKPCAPHELCESVTEAIKLHRETLRQSAAREDLRRRFEQLTESERQVLERLGIGKANKVIAAELNLSLRTVEMRRASILRKMQAHSLAELLRMEFELGRNDGESLAAF